MQNSWSIRNRLHTVRFHNVIELEEGADSEFQWSQLEVKEKQINVSVFDLPREYIRALLRFA